MNNEQDAALKVACDQLVKAAQCVSYERDMVVRLTGGREWAREAIKLTEESLDLLRAYARSRDRDAP